MSEALRIDFAHKQAAHCENGVVSNLMRHKGFEVSEPMVFGIGSGLLFSYLPFIKVNYAPVFTYRVLPGLVFNRFAKRVGVKVRREKFRNHRKAKARLDENLKNSNPVGLQVGVYHLIYFPDEYRFHFNAHNMVVYGKKEDRYLISDPVMEGVTTLTENQLEKVRFAKGAFAPKGHIYYPTAFPEKLELEQAVIKGIKQTCRDMTAPVPIVGVKAIRWVAKNIRKWPKKIGAKKTNHYLGQIVRMQEEIGTGGGGFRYIYAAFLQEAAGVLNNDRLKDFSKEMTEIGDLWRDFALEASRIYKNRSGETDGYNKIADQLMEIAHREKIFFKQLKNIV